MDEWQREIAKVLEAYKSAIATKDAGLFLGLYAEDAVVFDAWDTWSYANSAAWGEVVKAWFGSLGAETVAVEAEDVRIVGADAFATLSAIMTYAAIGPSGERLRALQNRLTWALSKQGKHWKIVHEHTSAPIRHDGLSAILSRGSRG